MLADKNVPNVSVIIHFFPHLNNKILSFFRYFNLIDEGSDDTCIAIVNDKNDDNNNNNNNNNNNKNKSN